ncbi:hypothetical protein A2U01_0101842, partial [Trifolium medium]|nr:hypothetical protein [Trifolium medium]
DWLQEVERIFRAMASNDAQRAMLAAHMLRGRQTAGGATCDRECKLQAS